MLNYFIRKAHGRKLLVHPRIVISVPSEITQVEKRAVIDSARRAKASEVYLVEQALVDAIGGRTSGHRAVRQHGGGYRRRHHRCCRHLALRDCLLPFSPCCGNEMDNAIMQYLKRKYNLLIGERTAEAIKIQIGSAFPLDQPLTMEIKGRNLTGRCCRSKRNQRQKRTTDRAGGQLEHPSEVNNSKSTGILPVAGVLPSARVARPSLSLVARLLSLRIGFDTVLQI